MPGEPCGFGGECSELELYEIDPSLLQSIPGGRPTVGRGEPIVSQLDASAASFPGRRIWRLRVRGSAPVLELHQFAAQLRLDGELQYRASSREEIYNQLTASRHSSASTDSTAEVSLASDERRIQGDTSGSIEYESNIVGSTWSVLLSGDMRRLTEHDALSGGQMPEALAERIWRSLQLGVKLGLSEEPPFGGAGRTSSAIEAGYCMNEQGLPFYVKYSAEPTWLPLGPASHVEFRLVGQVCITFGLSTEGYRWLISRLGQTRARAFALALLERLEESLRDAADIRGLYPQNRELAREAYRSLRARATAAGARLAAARASIRAMSARTMVVTALRGCWRLVLGPEIFADLLAQAYVELILAHCDRMVAIGQAEAERVTILKGFLATVFDQPLPLCQHMQRASGSLRLEPGPLSEEERRWNALMHQGESIARELLLDVQQSVVLSILARHEIVPSGELNTMAMRLDERVRRGNFERSLRSLPTSL